ncbi:hypothetical protein VNI00_007351 [Paramarasmius palmivorus]|uniref:Uncharacterized protein n=1 Tax=Paramarasmius palmivorus TaxID=297713 RepID=A0AAW0D3F6_9AGAR
MSSISSPPAGSTSPFISIVAKSLCHQELFNRIIDAYPRTRHGLLSSLRDGEEDPDLLELVVLRKLVDFPLDFEEEITRISVLAPKTRANVRLVIDTMRGLVPTENDIFSPMDCPLQARDSSVVLESLNLSYIPTEQLWALEVEMLEDRLRRYGEGHTINRFSARYNRFALHWMQTQLAQFLGISVPSGDDLVSAIDART